MRQAGRWQRWWQGLTRCSRSRIRAHSSRFADSAYETISIIYMTLVLLCKARVKTRSRHRNGDFMLEFDLLIGGNPV